MSDLDFSNLERHIQSSFDGISLLYEHSQFQQAKYCAFILIDQLAWLISGNQRKISVYFKEWVNRYFIRYYPSISADEIWAARNGHLHCNSSISRDVENKKVSRQLIYLDNLETPADFSLNSNVANTTLFPVNSYRFLRFALYYAVTDFTNDLRGENNFDIQDIKVKLDKVLSPIYLVN